MILDSLTAICGPSCAGCPAYIATQKNDRAALERIAVEWTEGLGRAFGAEDIICDGCRVQGGRLSAYCGMCDIRRCAVERRHDTCAHCPDVPCARIVAPPARDALAALRRELEGGES